MIPIFNWTHNYNHGDRLLRRECRPPHSADFVPHWRVVRLTFITGRWLSQNRREDARPCMSRVYNCIGTRLKRDFYMFCERHDDTTNTAVFRHGWSGISLWFTCSIMVQSTAVFLHGLSGFSEYITSVWMPMFFIFNTDDEKIRKNITEIPKVYGLYLILLQKYDKI